MSDRQLEDLCQEIATMREEVDLLHALQAAGVDNWEGYEDAVASLN